MRLLINAAAAGSERAAVGKRKPHPTPPLVAHEAMPTVVVNEKEVVLHLSYGERLAALSGDVRVPLAQVVSATVSQAPWSDARWSGINIGYILGTGLPYLLTFGHTVSLKGVDFVFLTRNIDGSTHPALVIVTRPPHRIRNIVVTAADALELAKRINVAAATAAFAARHVQAGAAAAPASLASGGAAAAGNVTAAAASEAAPPGTADEPVVAPAPARLDEAPPGVQPES